MNCQFLRPRAWVPALVLVGLGAVASEAHAQNAVISGRVTSDVGQPLYGANVYITELNISVGTNQQGAYTLSVPAARVTGQTVQLRVRSVGYAPQARAMTITAGNQTADFTLRTDVTRLSEVIVTGVSEGTERAKIPFSVASVNAEDLPAPAGNPLSQLQGRVPGANIASTSGRPGAEPQVLLRAPTSINASGRGQQPLYVVDGVILTGGLPEINASDIQSVEVVKGAAAASLYGARAGNGVIQITTKRGRNLEDDALRFGVRAEYGRSDIENRFGLAENHIYLTNPEGTAFCAQRACTSTFSWADEVLRLNSNSAALPLAPQFSPVNNGTTVWNTFQDGMWPGQTYNAIDQVVNPGATAQVDAQVTGRFSQTNFFASLGYMKNEGSFLGLEGYQRGSMRLNLDQAIGDDWTVQVSTYYARSQDDGAGQEGGSFFDLTRMPRGVNLLMRDTVRGEYIIRPDLQGENENPVYALVYQDRMDEISRFLGGLNIQYRPVDFFDIRAEASYDRADQRYSQFNDKGFRTARTSGAVNNGQVFRSSSGDQSWNGSMTASLRHTFGSDLGATLVGRYQYEQQDLDNANFTGRDLAVKGVNDADNARSPQIFIGSSVTNVRRIGYFLNGILDYADRYYVDALVRRDGSSLFGPDNRWATFGRLGASWRVTQEDWFNIPNVDELKLRYSVGTAGNSPSYAAQYEVYQLSGGSFTPTTLGNRDLGPELVTEQEAGVDMQLFGRVATSLTYSNVVTKDQILDVPLPAPSGFQRQWRNAGTMEGNTWEFSVDVPWVRTEDLTFSTRFQYDRSRSTITELNVPAFQSGVTNQGLEGVFFIREGERYGTIYGTKFATGCGDLPSGTDCNQFRTNSDGYFVWTGGADVGSGASRDASGNIVVAENTWGTAGPTLDGRLTPVQWGVPVVAQNAEGDVYLPLGNTLPDYRWAFNPTLNYKKLSATALVDATVGRSVYNQGRHWSYFENYSADQDQASRSDSELKPIGYYGSQGLYNVLQPNSHFVEDGSFVKLREVTLSYALGQVPGVQGDWTLSLIGRNLKTWTDYTGFDPEVGITGGQSGSGVINAFDAFRFPNLRSVTFAIQASF